MLQTRKTHHRVLKQVWLVKLLICIHIVFLNARFTIVEHHSHLGNFSKETIYFFNFFKRVKFVVFIYFYFFWEVDYDIINIKTFEFLQLLINFWRFKLFTFYRQTHNLYRIYGSLIHLEQIFPQRKLNNSPTFLFRCVYKSIKHFVLLDVWFLDKSIQVWKLAEMKGAFVLKVTFVQIPVNRNFWNTRLGILELFQLF